MAAKHPDNTTTTTMMNSFFSFPKLRIDGNIVGGEALSLLMILDRKNV